MKDLLALSVSCREFPFDSDLYREAVRLREEVLRKPLGRAWEARDFRGEDTSFHLGAFVDDRLVGVLILRPVDATTVQMRQVAVATDVQGRGIGSVLVRYAEQFAAARGYTRISAHARERALAFYRKLAYRVIGERFTEIDLPHFTIEKILEPPMSTGEYLVREGIEAMDFSRVHGWLAACYWSPDIARETVERGARHSALVIGMFTAAGVQVGYARVVSDCTRFAYICDVIVDDAYRGRGIGRSMVRHALAHPELATVKTWTLATRDAHGVYAPLGFKPMTDPESRSESWMVRRVTPPETETP